MTYNKLFLSPDRQASGNKGQSLKMPCFVYRRNLAYRGLRFAKMRWSVRRCIFKRRAVSDTFRSHISNTR